MRSVIHFWLQIEYENALNTLFYSVKNNKLKKKTIFQMNGIKLFSVDIFSIEFIYHI